MHRPTHKPDCHTDKIGDISGNTWRSKHIDQFTCQWWVVGPCKAFKDEEQRRNLMGDICDGCRRVNDNVR